MTIELTTERLKFRPLMMADATVLKDLIFNDAEVVKWLAYDISTPGNSEVFARDWCSKLGLEGDNTIWPRGGFGAFAITDRAGKIAAQDSLLGVVGLYGAEKKRQVEW